MQTTQMNQDKSSPLLSVVTISYNCIDDLRRTISSVENQTFIDFEFLIVDGGSTDNSLSYLKTKAGQFKDRNIPFKVLSEKDQGPYDAMNKGARLAQGSWVIFMNAGDSFFSSDTLQKSLAHLVKENEVVYGSTAVHMDNNFTRIIAGRPPNNLWFRMPFCHQSVFVKKDLLLDNPFSDSLKIVADHEFFLKLLTQGKSFKSIDIVIANFFAGGISSNVEKALEETKCFLKAFKRSPLQKASFHIHYGRVILFRKFAQIPFLKNGYRHLKYKNKLKN